jgi:RecB family exonuclease
VRVPDLAAFREVLIAEIAGLDAVAAADTFVVVPTRAAGEQLRRTVEDRLLAAPAAVLAWPLTGTRLDVYSEATRRSERPLDLLSSFDREVLLGRAAREVSAGGVAPPFTLRPALVAEMLRLYDRIRNQGRSVADFDRNLRGDLDPAAPSDRGAAALLAQTVFLAAVFERYERDLASAGACDEHAARAAILDSSPARALRTIVVTVGDRVADPDGLWPVDFTFLSALPGLERLDIIATEALLSAGFLERMHAAWPGLEEVRMGPVGGDPAGPVLVMPAAGDLPFIRSRDREEELVEVARRIKADRRAGDPTPLHRQALVVRRPLPYLYLARSVFGGAGIPFETVDTLPLAAEPYAAALDLVLDFVESGHARHATVALLRSPHFQFTHQGQPLTAASVSALDQALAGVRFLGGLARLTTLATEWREIEAPATREDRWRRNAVPAAAMAVDLAGELSALATPRPIADQLDTVQTFLDRHHTPAAAATEASREERVRQAVRHALSSLARAHRQHDPHRASSVAEVSEAVRRWLGAQTLAVPTGGEGLRILDAQAARFADVDDAQLVGLVDGEWPERTRPDIFYPAFLLALLDPAPAADDPNRLEHDALRAARASFRDLLRLPRLRVRVSAFQLEADALVEPSAFVDDVAAAGLPRMTSPRPALRVSTEDALAVEPRVLTHLPERTALWAALRASRRAGEGEPAGTAPRFQGEAGPWTLPRVSVTRIDRYLRCPFQFFASEVLRLPEEPEDEDQPPPWERGRFLHGLFETFFREWQDRGHGRVTADRLPEARALLIEISEREMATWPETDAALERVRLRGSAAGAGIIDRVLGMEAERTEAIDRRLVEYRLDAVFTFRQEDGATRPVPLRATIDRVDLLADGTFRVIDYKSRVLPDLKRTIQLPIYTSAVAQQLRRDGDRHSVPREAFYLSMEGEPPMRALRAGRGESLDDLVHQGEARLLAALDDIGEGRFPPRPSPKSLCNSCPYDTVCRKAWVAAVDD